MSRNILITLFIVLFTMTSPGSMATVWHVGSGFPYLLPSEVSGLTANGDTVDIAAGYYAGDCAAWTSDNLFLRAVGGSVHLEAAGNYIWGKGIWVCAGNNIRVEGIEFSGASVPDHNGAGIRLDGSGLIIQNCYFHHNENGILGGNSGVIRIENSEFAFNGFGDGYSHNIYINHADSLFIRYCYFHHAKIGHEIKSRAHVNIIAYNRISNEETGTASREIDLPNGGFAFVCGNLIHQGPQAENGTMLGYGLEGLSNTGPHHIYIINNSFVDQRHFNGIFMDIADGTGLLKCYNTLFAGGPGMLLTGNPLILDTAGIALIPDENAAGFTDLLNYNYSLTPASPVIDLGTSPGITGNIDLTPVRQYQHPLQSVNRPAAGPLDIGAFEFDPASQVLDKQVANPGILIDNLGGFQYNLQWNKSDYQFLILTNLRGQSLTVFSVEHQQSHQLNLYPFQHQLLFVRLIGKDTRHIIKLPVF